MFGEGSLPNGALPSIPAVVMLDEIHLHVANKGMQIGYLVRRLKHRLRCAALANAALALILFRLLDRFRRWV